MAFHYERQQLERERLERIGQYAQVLAARGLTPAELAIRLAKVHDAHWIEPPGKWFISEKFEPQAPQTINWRQLLATAPGWLFVGAITLLMAWGVFAGIARIVGPFLGQ